MPTEMVELLSKYGGYAGWPLAVLFIIMRYGKWDFITVRLGKRKKKKGNLGNPGNLDSFSIGDLENPKSLVTVGLMKSEMSDVEKQLKEGTKRFEVIDGKLNTIGKQGNRLVRAFYALKAVSETVKDEEPPELNNFDEFES